jgi:hypothetical protein
MRLSCIPALLCTLLLGGCTLLPYSATRSTVSTPTREDPASSAAADYLHTMARLNQGSPAEQAEIFQTARDAAETAPTTTNRLRYALALATPGHGAANPQSARQLLAEVLATPEALLGAELALAQITLESVEQYLLLQSENERLQGEAARSNDQRASATQRRLQTELEENKRLRQQLEEAQAKLDEITRIERSISERKPSAKK